VRTGRNPSIGVVANPEVRQVAGRVLGAVASGVASTSDALGGRRGHLSGCESPAAAERQALPPAVWEAPSLAQAGTDGRPGRCRGTRQDLLAKGHAKGGGGGCQFHSSPPGEGWVLGIDNGVGA